MQALAPATPVLPQTQQQARHQTPMPRLRRPVLVVGGESARSVRGSASAMRAPAMALRVVPTTLRVQGIARVWLPLAPMAGMLGAGRVPRAGAGESVKRRSVLQPALRLRPPLPPQRRRLMHEWVLFVVVCACLLACGTAHFSCATSPVQQIYEMLLDAPGCLLNAVHGCRTFTSRQAGSCWRMWHAVEPFAATPANMIHRHRDNVVLFLVSLSARERGCRRHRAVG